MIGRKVGSGLLVCPPYAHARKNSNRAASAKLIINHQSRIARTDVVVGENEENKNGRW